MQKIWDANSKIRLKVKNERLLEYLQMHLPFIVWKNGLRNLIDWEVEVLLIVGGLI
jgi:hypothetical protein